MVVDAIPTSTPPDQTARQKNLPTKREPYRPLCRPSRDPLGLSGRTMCFTIVGENARRRSCVSIRDSRSLHDQSGIRNSRFDSRCCEYANHHQYHVDSVQSANRTRTYLRPHRHLCQLGGSAVSCVKHRCCSCHRIFDSVNGTDCPHCSARSICSSENREKCQ